jgi:hypothetical protein
MMIASPAKIEQANVFVMVVTALLSAVTVLPGAWGLIAPEAFGEFVRFPLMSASEHFVHDSGAFAVGTGAALGFYLARRLRHSAFRVFGRQHLTHDQSLRRPTSRRLRLGPMGFGIHVNSHGKRADGSTATMLTADVPVDGSGVFSRTPRNPGSRS